MKTNLPQLRNGIMLNVTIIIICLSVAYFWYFQKVQLSHKSLSETTHSLEEILANIYNDPLKNIDSSNRIISYVPDIYEDIVADKYNENATKLSVDIPEME